MEKSTLRDRTHARTSKRLTRVLQKRLTFRDQCQNLIIIRIRLPTHLINREQDAHIHSTTRVVDVIGVQRQCVMST